MDMSGGRGRGACGGRGHCLNMADGRLPATAFASVQAAKIQQVVQERNKQRGFWCGRHVELLRVVAHAPGSLAWPLLCLAVQPGQERSEALAAGQCARALEARNP
jgi:hypothetical protein